MRAVVTAPFHHPVSGVLLKRGTELFDADLTPLIEDHPDHLHRVTFTDRTATPSAPTPAPAFATWAATTLEKE